MLKLMIVSILVIGQVEFSAPVFAGNCGGHCQLMKECGAKVRAKGTVKGQFQAEWNKCMVDPYNYK